MRIRRPGDTAHDRPRHAIVTLQKIRMEKILLAVDGYRQNTYAIDFACYLAKLTHSQLTGVFLDGASDSGGPAITPPAGQGLKHVQLFQDACLRRDIAAKVHRDPGVPVGDILLESRFSDLIVVDPETSFRTADNDFPGRFVRDVLLAAECPVVVSPYQFDGLNEVIFAYNGTNSSVFAIKQFTYLFPEFRNKSAVVVRVSNSDESAMEEQCKMKEWLSAHYDNVEFVLLKGDASDELFGHLLQRKNAIVVMGAYGRGILSRFLKPSHASLLLRSINLPIFIAHR
jgi:nucleotide-binding universal stress UspA family protein